MRSRVATARIMRHIPALFFVLASAAPALADSSSNMPKPMPHSAVQMAPVTFADLPGWGADNHVEAFGAFRKSCARVMAAAGDGTLIGSNVPGPEFLAACHEALASGSGKISKAKARAFFEHHFTPHRVMHGAGPGLLTGYYEPVLDGARTPQGAFRVPIYRRPPDLVNVVSEADRGAKSVALTHVRQTAEGTAPYFTRAEIEQGALRNQGLELLYLDNEVDAFFMQIQGSGRIRLRDGSMVRVGYDGKNGYPYTSIGRYLINSGQFQADKVSLGTLRKWLLADAERGRQVMWQNKSFVFFREIEGADADGPMGVLDIPLTPGRSLAVDTTYHTLGMPIYVSAPKLTHATRGGFQRLMIAQDVGSAIKGPERGDIYFGSGDKAGKLAGITKHAGNFFVLLPTKAESGPVTIEAHR
jgi:membrane-bound lytic murein transglycosylase A